MNNYIFHFIISLNINQLITKNMKLLLSIILSIFVVVNAAAQSCFSNGITFTTQAAIDNFQVEFPGWQVPCGVVRLAG